MHTRTFCVIDESEAALLNAGIEENEIVAVHKVNPTNAATLADKIASMQKSLKNIELALRQAGAQASFAKNTASGGK